MMQEDKWYKKALIYLIIVILSPLILIGFLRLKMYVINS